MIYYIVLQVWAWHQSGLRRFAATSGSYCILPFEATWFSERGVRAHICGTSLLDQNEISLPEPNQKF